MFKKYLKASKLGQLGALQCEAPGDRHKGAQEFSCTSTFRAQLTDSHVSPFAT